MCLLFVLWQSDHFMLRYSQFDNWPWTFKVKLTTKIDQNLIRSFVCQGQQSCQKSKKSRKLFKSYRVNKNQRPAAAYEPVQKHSHPRYTGVTWLLVLQCIWDKRIISRIKGNFMYRYRIQSYTYKNGRNIYISTYLNSSTVSRQTENEMKWKRQTLFSQFLYCCLANTQGGPVMIQTNLYDSSCYII